MRKNIIFVAFTKSHYLMVLKILDALKSINLDCSTKIFCSGYLHDQGHMFCKSTINRFDYSIFINDFDYVRNKLKLWKLRYLVSSVNEEFNVFSPDAVITFSDNGYIYQDSYNRWNKKSKVILFHEGYGDYSDPVETKKLITYYYIKLILFPYKYIPIARSYTGHYKYSFLLEPSLISRNFSFERVAISSSFIKSIYFSKKVIKEVIKPNSILVVLSGRDWINTKKLNEYFLYLFNLLGRIDRFIYVKIAPSRNISEYMFLSNNRTIIIDNPKTTSEAYCFHDSFDYIVTDESSSVINAIYGGMQKTVFFLNQEIMRKGCSGYDRNDLVSYLIKEKKIVQTTVRDMVDMVNSNYSIPIKLSLTNELLESDNVGKEMRRIIYG